MIPKKDSTDSFSEEILWKQIELSFLEPLRDWNQSTLNQASAAANVIRFMDKQEENHG